MASLPPRQQSQRRTSPTQSSSSASARDEQRRSESENLAQSTTSSEAQVLHLNDGSHTDSGSTEAQPSASGDTASEQPRQCWICLQDETEDTPQSSAWRNPCPCALTAHEKCMLEWADDMQRQKSDVTVGNPPSGELVCPMCRAQIVLARPHARLSKLVTALDALTSRAVLPTLGLGLVGSALIVASHHGAHSIRMIFGSEDAEVILAPRHGSSWLADSIRSHFPLLELPSASMLERRRGARLGLGLPLIPVALIASRTPWAETILPFFPMILFAVNSGDASLVQYQWPPSAALTIATLPYLGVFYGEFMGRVWTPWERAWLKEIHPRRQDESSASQGDDERAAGDEIVQVEIQLNLGDEENDDGEEVNDGRVVIEAQDEDRARENGPGDDQRDQGRGQDNDAAEVDVDDIADRLQAALGERREQGQAQGQQQQQQQREPRSVTNDAVLDFTSMCKSMIGALLFPSISAAVGEVLRMLLPRSWVQAQVVGSGWGKKEVPSGLLQTRWGRSIIGGCLAVVLKDAIRIYCRWRMAQSHRTRSILDYDKKAGRVVGPSRQS